MADSEVTRRFETVRVKGMKIFTQALFRGVPANEVIKVTAEGNGCTVQFECPNDENRPRIGQYLTVTIEDYGPGSESYPGEFSEN